MNTSLILDAQYSEAFEKLTDEQLGQLTRALMKYSQTGEMPSFSDKVIDIAFTIIRKDIDKINARRVARCQRNRENAQKRWSKKRGGIRSKGKRSDISSKKEETPAVSSSVNYNSLLAYWNKRIVETRSKMPTITRIDNNRRRLLAARISEYGSTRSLQSAFEKAFVSPYLNGKNKNCWVANIDWILKEGNFSRVLDGVFNRGAEPHNTPLAIANTMTQKDIKREQTERILREEERRKKNNDNLRCNIMAAIKAAERNPHSIHAKVAYIAYNNGTMAQLGICWTPPKLVQYDTQSGNRQVAQ